LAAAIKTESQAAVIRTIEQHTDATMDGAACGQHVKGDYSDAVKPATDSRTPSSRADRVSNAAA